MKLLWFIEYLDCKTTQKLITSSANKRRQQVNKYSLYWKCSLYVT